MDIYKKAVLNTYEIEEAREDSITEVKLVTKRTKQSN